MRSEIKDVKIAMEKKQSGDRLTVREARLLSGYTVEEMAKAFKVTPPTYLKREAHPEKITMEEADIFLSMVKLDYHQIIFLR